MYGHRLYLLFSLALLQVALAMPTVRSANDNCPVEPVHDPFYLPPEGFESSPPGTTLRSREPPFPIAAFSIAEVNLASAHQLLFRSTDTFGNPIVAASTILVPHNADPTKLLSYQVAQDSASPNCVPKMPLFVYKSANDEVSPVNDTDALVSKYCERGADVEYKRDKLSEHVALWFAGAPDAIIWLTDRMNGVPVKQGCHSPTSWLA